MRSSACNNSDAAAAGSAPDALRTGALPADSGGRRAAPTAARRLRHAGKNQQQITQGIAKTIRTYHKVLGTFASSGRSELALLTSLQVQCYEDTRLLKQFSDIVKMMYDCEVRTGAAWSTGPSSHTGRRRRCCSRTAGQPAPQAHTRTHAPPPLAPIFGEDTILHWYKKGSHAKGRNVFLKVGGGLRGAAA
jgi:hypothetical protein